MKVERGSLSKPPAPTNLQVPDNSGSIPAYFTIRWDSVPKEYSKYGIVYYINEIADYDEGTGRADYERLFSAEFLEGLLAREAGTFTYSVKACNPAGCGPFSASKTLGVEAFKKIIKVNTELLGTPLETGVSH